MMSDPLTSGPGKRFFDTNIFVYAVDNADPVKRDRSRAILRHAATEGLGVVSTQVLQELYVVLTKKLSVDPIDAKEMVTSQEHFEVIVITPRLIRDAMDRCVLSRLSFWDALIVTAADTARCAMIVSEDLNHGQRISGVQVINPYLGSP